MLCVRYYDTVPLGTAATRLPRPRWVGTKCNGANWRIGFR